MKTRIENLLMEATIRTFENTCFMFVEPDLEDIQKNLALEAAAEVRFQGNFSGKLIIESRGGLFSAIATNMLSNDHPISQQKEDALGEIANIICGNVVPSLGRRKELGYKIESPISLNKKELLKKEKGKPLAEVTLNFNQGRTDIKLFVDDYNPSEGKKID
jgi:chemotaxis protein CheY-P-specific phosphatase CheC